MKPIVYLAGAVGVVAIGGAFLVQAASEPAPGLFAYDDAAVVAQGQGIYDEYCASCHGANLEGQPNWRMRNANGRLPAPPHDVSGHTWHHPDVQLFEIVKWGTAALVGGGYESDMAGYADVLSDD